ncbi:MAG: cell division protein ZapA [Treponema sp.]|nr:cell division protein ZapA [Treponema sp.]
MNEPLPESPPESGTGPHDLLIQVLGASISITAGEDPAFLDEVLAQYQLAIANTQGISQMKDPLKIAILTGFLLCGEINKLKMQYEEEHASAESQQAGEVREIDRIARDLIARIDRVIEETSPPDA